MTTKSSVPKPQQPKTNNFVSILDQFLKKYNLSVNSSPDELVKHASELGAFLPDSEACRSIKRALTRRTERRSAFSKEQIEALLPDKRKGKLTIEEKAKYCAKTGDFIDIVANH